MGCTVASADVAPGLISLVPHLDTRSSPQRLNRHYLDGKEVRFIESQIEIGPVLQVSRGAHGKSKTGMAILSYSIETSSIKLRSSS